MFFYPRLPLTDIDTSERCKCVHNGGKNSKYKHTFNVLCE